MPPQLLPTRTQLQVAAMSGGTGGHPTFRGFLKASGQAEVWDDTDKKKFDQVFLMFALCKVHTQDDLHQKVVWPKPYLPYRPRQP